MKDPPRLERIYPTLDYQLLLQGLRDINRGPSRDRAEHIHPCLQVPPSNLAPRNKASIRLHTQLGCPGCVVLPTRTPVSFRRLWCFETMLTNYWKVIGLPTIKSAITMKQLSSSLSPMFETSHFSRPLLSLPSSLAEILSRKPYRSMRVNAARSYVRSCKCHAYNLLSIPFQEGEHLPEGACLP